MAKLDHALWRDMMAYLRQRHAPLCRQWFEELRPLGMESGLLKVSVSNAVQQNYLQKRCVEQFTEAAQAVTGALVAVRFLTAAETGNGNGSGNGPTALTPPLPLGLAGSGSATPATPATAATAATAAALAAARVVGPQPTLRPPPIVRHISPAAVETAAHPTAPHVRLSHRSDLDPQRPSDRPAVPPHGTQTPPDPDGELVFESIVLSPDYSFDNFVSGPNNRLAYAAAVAVANQPGTAYNPLFIHGGVGLGKTHLLQAICQQILQHHPAARICYLSCDAFMNQFLECVQRGRMNEFRHYYRHVDVLVIDDIHFLAKRERSQEEFFHTFNELYQSNRQIVLSSDSPPAEIPQLEERLVSRFQWGLVTNVTRPDYETRVAIVRAKSKLRGIDLPDDVACYIATRIDSNARELEGAITTVLGHAALQGRTLDTALAREALGEPPGARNGQITLQEIIDAVTAYYNVKLSDLQSKRRHKSITMPRQVCMWLARRHTRFSLQEIGAYFGGRDHTTVMHSIAIVDERSRADASLSQQLTHLENVVTKNA